MRSSCLTQRFDDFHPVKNVCDLFPWDILQNLFGKFGYPEGLNLFVHCTTINGMNNFAELRDMCGVWINIDQQFFVLGCSQSISWTFAYEFSFSLPCHVIIVVYLMASAGEASYSLLITALSLPLCYIQFILCPYVAFFDFQMIINGRGIFRCL